MTSHTLSWVLTLSLPEGARLVIEIDHSIKYSKQVDNSINKCISRDPQAETKKFIAALDIKIRVRSFHDQAAKLTLKRN
jgi:hypothetical protein